jgi:hypothetical protein
VHEPGPLAAALQGDRVTSQLADRLPPMVAELRRMDDAHSPLVVLSLAERDFAWVPGLLDQSSYDEVTGRRLHVAMAELGQVAGYAAYDLGDHGRAQRFYMAGLRAAHTAGDRVLGAHILKCLAEQSADLGHPQDALMLIDSALAGSRGATSPGQTALLHSWRARAQASLGDEPDHAAASGGRALDLASQRSSQRSVGRIRDLCRQMTGRRDVPAVREFLERARGLVA